MGRERTATEKAMAGDVEGVLSRLDQDVEGALARLFELLRIPSVSTDPAHDADCDRAAA